MYFSLTEIILISFLVILDEGLSAELKCDTFSATHQHEIVQCNGTFFKPVCLSCNLSKSATSVYWFLDHQQLTHDEFIIRNIGDIDINHCHSELFSLRLKNPSTENHNASYRCVKDEENVSEFLLKLKAETKMYINTTRIYLGKLLVNEKDVNSSVRCLIEGAVPPFSLTWYFNGEVQDKKTFNYSAEVHYSDFLFGSKNLKNQNIVTCSSQGKYIIPNSTSLPVYPFKIQQGSSSENDTSPTKSRSSPYKLDLVLIPLASAILSVILICFVVKGILRNRLERVDMGTDDPYYYVDQLANEMCTESEEGNIDVTTCLDTKVSVHGLFEYWTGTFSTGGEEHGKCFGKRLSDQGTLQEASEFKLLARRLLALKESENTVEVLAINIEMEPFLIVTEFLEYGSLRDFVRARYQQLDIDITGGMETTLKTQVKELLVFSVNVAKAMEFLESQEFCHPFVSLKKVLLTSQCGCKLYDIHPNDMAMIKVKKMLKENNPPTAWMTPETIFLGEYEQSCDAWSFSVLLWELFSLGEMPYAGSTNAEIENTIRDGKLLSQPTNCPGSVYETMLMSWQKDVEKRPSFAVLSTKLEAVLKGNQEVEDTEGKGLSFALNANESGDYI